MNLYPSTLEYLRTLPVIEAWPEFQDILNRMAFVEPRDWQLPVKACQAVGGSIEQAIPATAAIACAQIAIIMIDDMLDEDPRGEYRRLGFGPVANLALSFQAVALAALFSSGLKSASKLSALQSIDRMTLTVAFGQHMDVQNLSDEAAYWHVVEAKSAAFFGAAFHLGALVGGASGEVLAALERFGQLFGEIIQIHDDLNDALEVPANPDWGQGRSPLPILFAKLVDHPDRLRFLKLSRAVANPEALEESQKILASCGAVSYCVDQLLLRYRAAQSILKSVPLMHRDELESLLEGTIAPVRKLFDALGKPQARISKIGELGSPE